MTPEDDIQKFNALTAVFDSMPVGVFAILDPKLNIVTINRAAGDMLRSDIKEIIGKNAGEVFENRFPGIQKLIDETIKHRRPIKNFTLEIEDSHSQVKNYLVSTAITKKLEHSDFGIILVFHDISEVIRLRRTTMSLKCFGPIVGGTSIMKEIYSLIETVAPYNTTVLIFGETGTGKELVARAIHEFSPRAQKPFITVSCPALTSTLLESELFGHIKGAYTGALKDRAGRFEIARGGTLFLDEVGALPGELQAKLLRALQERIIERVGSSEPIPVDVRVISATNRDLAELVAKGAFRDDLYYRLKVFQVDLPPLRARRPDIPVLADHFIEKFNRLYRRNVIGLSPSALTELMKYSWPGNVRELENTIEHAMVLTQGKIIEPQYFPPEIRFMRSNGTPPLPAQNPRLEENIRRALAAFDGSISRAASNLGMHRTTLWRKMREFGITKKTMK